MVQSALGQRVLMVVVQVHMPRIRLAFIGGQVTRFEHVLTLRLIEDEILDLIIVHLGPIPSTRTKVQFGPKQITKVVFNHHPQPQNFSVFAASQYTRFLSKLNVQIYQQLPWLASSIASCRNSTTFGILEMTPAST